MPNFYCCVPGCSSAVQKKSNLKKYPWMRDVTFHPFPTLKSKCMRRKWLRNVRRELTWEPNKYSRVCSLHFQDDRPTQRCPAPAIFSWQKNSQERSQRADYPPIEPTVQTPLPSGLFIDLSRCEDVWFPFVCGEITVETSAKIKPYVQQNPPFDVPTPRPSKDHNYCIKTDVQPPLFRSVSCQTDMTIGDICLIEGENNQMKKTLENKDNLLKDLLMDKVTESDNSVRSYTGFPSKRYLDGVFNILNVTQSKLNYWRGEHSHKIHKYQTEEGRIKPGPKRKLSAFEEFVLTWMRIRLGLTTMVLGHLFGVSQSRVSQIFITWITFMYHTLGPLLKWPSHEQVKKNMPPSFRHKYPRTRAIIDCTEFFFQKPRSPHAQSVTYSTYKSMNTAKLLVSITPSGMFNFISELYGGNASDRFITQHSGFLDKLEYGDDVMADRGFTIRDLVTLRHATLNIPPFTSKCKWGKGKYLSPSEIVKTRSIAKLRIHVERAIQRMKWFRLLNQVMPWSLKPMLNQIVTIVAVVCNMHPKLVRH